MKLSARKSSRNTFSQSQYKNVIVLLAIFSLSACANMSERQKIYGEAAGTGAAVGAAGGAAIYEENRLLGAFIGGTVGTIAGYAVGDHQANKIARMGQQSSYREQTISGLQQQNAVMVKYNDRLKRTIDQYQRDINRRIDRRRAAGEELRKAQNAYNGLLSVLARERQAAAQTSNPNQRRIYQNQLRQLEEEIQKLDRSIRRLNNICYGRVG